MQDLEMAMFYRTKYQAFYENLELSEMFTQHGKLMLLIVRQLDIILMNILPKKEKYTMCKLLSNAK